MLLKNNEGKLIEVKCLDVYYGARTWKQDIEENITNIEMYDNGYIKRIEWKDKEKWRNAVFDIIENRHKGILCYVAESDGVRKR